MGTQLEGDAILDPEITVGSTAPPPSPQCMLLTGANGFVGSHILAALLKRTAGKVYCPMRGTDEIDVRRKLSTAFARYQLGTLPMDRVVTICGDLRKPGLGLGEARLASLSNEVDTIYHSAGDTNLVREYDGLKPTNVYGTEQIIRFACRGRTKALHHVSTLGVFDALALRTVVMEGDDIGDGSSLFVGYQKSKWVAEKLVEQAASRGVPCTIYRPK